MAKGIDPKFVHYGIRKDDLAMIEAICATEDIDFERRSGEITLFLLNVLLLVFIATYNYEQFFEVGKKTFGRFQI